MEREITRRCSVGGRIEEEPRVLDGRLMMIMS